MIGNKRAAQAAATARSGEKESGWNSSNPYFYSIMKSGRMQRVLAAIMKAAMNDGVNYISFSALSCILLIPEREIIEILDTLDGADVVVCREEAV